jgi:hypothetical protein
LLRDDTVEYSIQEEADAEIRMIYAMAIGLFSRLIFSIKTITLPLCSFEPNYSNTINQGSNFLTASEPVLNQI